MLQKYIEAGGPIMWPLLACSAALVAVLIERFWTVLVRGRIMGRPLGPGRLGHRRVLPFFVDVPPALGLLGTVLGLVQSFQLLDGEMDTTRLGAGLATACTTTIFGLSVALVATVGGYALDWIADAPPADLPAAPDPTPPRTA